LGTRGSFPTRKSLRGRLYAASFPATAARISSSGALDSTTATGISPSRSSGQETTTASLTRSSFSSAASTSSGVMLKPPQMMMFFSRPVM
jgi:hypothetical protein